MDRYKFELASLGIADNKTTRWSFATAEIPSRPVDSGPPCSAQCIDATSACRFKSCSLQTGLIGWQWHLGLQIIEKSKAVDG